MAFRNSRNTSFPFTQFHHNGRNYSFGLLGMFLHAQHSLVETQRPPCSGDLFTVWQVSLVINCVCGFLTLFGASYLLYSMARQEKIVPVYIMNLMVSDLLQLSAMVSMAVRGNSPHTVSVSELIYRFGEMASVAFMVCVAFERYLVIVCPLWYRTSQNVKRSFGVCALVWVFAIAAFLPTCFCGEEAVIIILTVYHVVPIPLFLFFLFGVLKGLSGAIHMTPAEKQRIVGILVLPIIFYCVIIVPNIIAYYHLDDVKLIMVSLILVLYSPLANVILYIFIRKGSLDRLCCCKTTILV